MTRPAAPIPALVGPYKILGVLGEGAAAIVYLAEQARPLRRRVALKVLRTHLLSEDAVFRFEQELQTLARLRHDHIAQVFDYSARGRESPYFTMEYVEGPSVTDYANAHRLTVRQRLMTFLQTCDAVRYIHQNGVVHRDIKPSNVLVEDREGGSSTKLIDFGVAKLGPEHRHAGVPATDEGRLLGTLGYMSPEQLDEGEIDTRADIYSLGVLLYELLAGSLPIEAPRSMGEMPDFLRRLKEQRPEFASERIATAPRETAADLAGKRNTRPAVLIRELRDNLDWIVRKALEKDPDDRYATVAEMARDIRAHLRGDPVAAGPASAAYHLRQGVRRNLPYVAAALLVVAMVASAVALSAFWHLRLGARHQDQVRFLRLGEAVQVRATNAHLWLEEAVAGDPDVDLARDVYQPVTESTELVRAAIDGGPTPLGEFEPATDPVLAGLLRDLAGSLEEFRAISRARWIQRLDKGDADAALDRTCDSLHHDILRLSSSVSIRAGSMPTDEQQDMSRTILAVNLGAAALSLVLLAAVARSWVARSRRMSGTENA